SSFIYSAYRPESLQRVLAETHFTRRELRAIYRAFKETSSNALIHRDIFRAMFAELFPHGDTEHYADLIFETFELDTHGAISFHKFAKLLSTLSRGTLEEKLDWLYRLYDPKNSGKIEWHRIFYIITAVDDLIGTKVKPVITDEERIEHANHVFQKFDRTKKGWISREDFLVVCSEDKDILSSIASLYTILPV
uniref:EF-hand domain-containing protein n=1 Tax=Parascaris univalens TaxID=6257 RepID=A0A915BA49_PARUN